MTRTPYERQAARMLGQSKRMSDCLGVMMKILNHHESTPEKAGLLESIEMVMGNNAEVAVALRKLFPGLTLPIRPKGRK